jgi:hypothetical protein
LSAGKSNWFPGFSIGLSTRENLQGLFKIPNKFFVKRNLVKNAGTASLLESTGAPERSGV